MRDYVRRGLHNLDDIVNDYDSSEMKEWEKQVSPVSPYKTNPTMRAIRSLFDEWYGGE